ncbi:MAG: pyridoxal 5'-phosphate synthase glutaminase subunit PdxT [Candidatus Eisenbacteria bacterium]|nr:pyridoxal 5'-phosphate synthase glutaminase subunit PdxT [Candidatus Eisenbacteria bacterium]
MPGVDGEPAPRPRVGVLSLQGDFERHSRTLEACGASPVRVTLPEHLADLGALVLPGGESSTMLRLMDATGLRAPLETFLRVKPVLGTCAGVILLGRETDRLPRETFGVLDIATSRNAYGRQVHSFTAPVEAPAAGGTLTGVFIRAPRITRVGAGVEVIARRERDRGESEVVGVRCGNVVGITFHPELTGDLRLHRWFLTAVAQLALPTPAAASGPRTAAEPRGSEAA